jgi:hypothetical protein
VKRRAFSRPRDDSASDASLRAAHPVRMWKKSIRLLTEHGYASRAIAVNLPVALRGRLTRSLADKAPHLKIEYRL